MPKESGPQQINLPFRSFFEYTQEEREALAASVRLKKPEELTPEELRYRDWITGLDSPDDDNPHYGHH